MKTVTKILTIAATILLFSNTQKILCNNIHIGILTIQGDLNDSEPYVKSLYQAQNDSEIVGILIILDSERGKIGAAENIYREILRTKNKKPVVAWIKHTCSSEAYLAVSSATALIAPASATFYNNKLTASEPSETLCLVTTLQNEEYQAQHTAQLHTIFCSLLAAERYFSLNSINTNKPLTGEQAHKYGLIDSIGGYSDALDLIQNYTVKRNESHIQNNFKELS